MTNPTETTSHIIVDIYPVKHELEEIPYPVEGRYVPIYSRTPKNRKLKIGALFTLCLVSSPIISIGALGTTAYYSGHYYKKHRVWTHWENHRTYHKNRISRSAKCIIPLVNSVVMTRIIVQKKGI